MYCRDLGARGYALSGQDGHHHPRKDAGGGCSPLTETYSEEAIASILTSYIAHSEDKNPTAQAIRQRFQGQVAYPMLSNLPL